jgi:hypothetical protein
MDSEKDAIDDYIVAQSRVLGLTKTFLTSNAGTNNFIEVFFFGTIHLFYN